MDSICLTNKLKQICLKKVQQEKELDNELNQLFGHCTEFYLSKHVVDICEQLFRMSLKSHLKLFIHRYNHLMTDMDRFLVLQNLIGERVEYWFQIKTLVGLLSLQLKQKLLDHLEFTNNEELYKQRYDLKKLIQNK